MSEGRRVFEGLYELFLVNGSADSLITAELSNWNGKAIKIPRIEVASCDRDDITQAGVYFLFCKEDDGPDSVYIGEAENVKERLCQHLRDYQADKETSFRTFASLCIDRQLYSAVQNSNRQKHQPLNSYVSLSDENESDHLEGAWSEDPEALIIDQESTRTLEREITKVLSPMENKVLDYYLRGYGYVKIAEIMGKTPKSIDNALQRIRGKIRNFSAPVQK